MTVRWTIDVDELAEVLHDVMCDVSHHDRPPARCSRWPKYPAIARSAFGALARRALAKPSRAAAGGGPVR